MVKFEMHTSLKYLLTISWLFIVPYGHADVFKCTIDGKVLFTDKPCPGGQTAEQIDTPANISGTGSSGKSYTIPSNWLTGYQGYNQAVELSRQLNVPILLYFKADWCGYCKKLEKELLGTSEGMEALSNAIKVRVKPEDSAANNSLFKRLGGRGYPSIFIQKTYDSPPAKRYLMTKESGHWKTRGADYLAAMLKTR